MQRPIIRNGLAFTLSLLPRLYVWQESTISSCCLFAAYDMSPFMPPILRWCYCLTYDHTTQFNSINVVMIMGLTVGGIVFSSFPGSINNEFISSIAEVQGCPLCHLGLNTNPASALMLFTLVIVLLIHLFLL